MNTFFDHPYNAQLNVNSIHFCTHLPHSATNLYDNTTKIPWEFASISKKSKFSSLYSLISSFLIQSTSYGLTSYDVSIKTSSSRALNQSLRSSKRSHVSCQKNPCILLLSLVRLKTIWSSNNFVSNEKLPIKTTFLMKRMKKRDVGFRTLRSKNWELLAIVELIESLRIDCSLIYLDELSITLIYSYLLISRTVVKCSSKLKYDLFKLRS